MRYALTAYVASLILPALAVTVLYFALGVRVPFGVGALLVEASFLATLIPLYRRGSLGVEDLGLRRVPGGRSVGLVLLALLAIGSFDVLWSRALHLAPVNSSLTGLSDQSTATIVLTGLALSAAAPVVEEIFFRGLIYRCLRNRFAIAPASVLAGAMFGLVHTQYPLSVLPELAFFGVVACLLYERTGSLLPGIAMHAVIDASAFEFSLTGSSAVVELAFLLLAIILVGWSLLQVLARSLTSRQLVGTERSARLAVLLVCLAVAATGLLASRTRASSAPGEGPAQANVGCSLGPLPPLAKVDFQQLVDLRAGLLGVMAEVGGRRYVGGTVTPDDMWSDDPPQPLSSLRSSDGRWPGGYEIRQWAPTGDDTAADVLLFTSASQAGMFFDEAASARCHRAAEVMSAPSPPAARNLVWVNPDGPTEEDVFVLRGRRLYRVVDVRPVEGL